MGRNNVLIYFPQNLKKTLTLQLRSGLVYKANLEFDRVRLQSYVSKRRQKIFKYTHSAEPNHRGFFRIYPPPGGTVLPTTARVSGIEFKPSVIHFLFVLNNIIPVSFSLPLYLSLFHFSSSALFRSPFLVSLFVDKYSPSTKRVFFTGFRKSPFTFCYIFAVTAVADSLSRVNTKHASRLMICKEYRNNKNKFLSEIFFSH